MSTIRGAQVVAFYLFDVAESADLAQIPGLIGGPAVPARLAPKPATPSYVQYEKPPLSFEGEAVGIGETDGFRARFRVFDYGVISVALVRPFFGDWRDLVELGRELIDNDEIEQRAEELCRSIVVRLRGTLTDAHDTFLSEDYIVFAVHDIEPTRSAEALMADHGEDIATLLRGERQPLSGQERSAILGHRLSYLADDLVVPTWNAAFVFDTPAGVQAALEIMEFANSQLLEFRHYDQLLDNELTSIYAALQRPRWTDRWVGARYTRAARQVHALFIDVSELTDRTENALKFVGDIYAARLFRLVADRLGLERWKADVEQKLETLDAIYRFAADQASMSRGQFLELTIVLILLFELLLVFMGVMQ